MRDVGKVDNEGLNWFDNTMKIGSVTNNLAVL
jgi:hypothetical protein